MRFNVTVPARNGRGLYFREWSDVSKAVIDESVHVSPAFHEKVPQDDKINFGLVLGCRNLDNSRQSLRSSWSQHNHGSLRPTISYCTMKLVLLPSVYVFECVVVPLTATDQAGGAR